MQSKITRSLVAIAERARTFTDRFDGFDSTWTPDTYCNWFNLITAIAEHDDLLEEIAAGKHPKLRPVQPSGTRREIVNQLLIASKQWTGLTSTELESHHRLRKSHQTVSPALTALRKAGWIQDSGQRRMSSSGRPATVWQLTVAALCELRRAE